MSQELREVHQRIVRLRALLHQAIRSHAILTTLSEWQTEQTPFEASNGDPAKEHPMMTSAYTAFLSPVNDSLLLDAHIQLAKLLIDNEKSLHLKKLLGYFRSHERRIRKSSEEPNYLDSIKDFSSMYIGALPGALEEVAIQLEVNEWLITKLAIVRNKKLGHEDMRDIPAEMLTLDEIKKLIDLAELILTKLAQSYAGFDLGRHGMEDDARQVTRHVLDRLYSIY